MWQASNIYFCTKDEKQQRLKTYLDFSLDFRKLVFSSSKLCISLGKWISLWFDIAEHMEESDDINNPGTKSTSSQRLAFDELRLKFRIGYIWLNGFQIWFMDVFFVVMQKLIKERVNLAKKHWLSRLDNCNYNSSKLNEGRKENARVEAQVENWKRHQRVITICCSNRYAVNWNRDDSGFLPVNAISLDRFRSVMTLCKTII